MENVFHSPEIDTNTAGFRAPYRVLFVIDRLVIGGPTDYVICQARGLNPSLFSSHMIAGRPAIGEQDVSYRAENSGIDLITLPEMSREIKPLSDLKVVLKLIVIFFRLRPTIVATHKSKAGATGRIATLVYRWFTVSALWLRPREVHVIHTFHGHVLHGYFGPLKSRIILHIERLLARLATDAIVVLSHQQQRELCNELKIGSPEQFKIIPLATEFDRLISSERRLRTEFLVPAETFLVGSIGRLCEIKNFPLLIEAMRDVIYSKPTRSHWQLVIIGGGHLQLDLERQAKSLGLEKNVIFTGFRNDVASFYQDLDLVALSSLNEGTPMTLIEGMIAGRPVLSTEVGGVVDIMGKCRGSHEGFKIWDHGITSPSGDVAAYARAIIFLAENPELRSSMGHAARSYAMETFALERLFSDVQELFISVIGRAYLGNNRSTGA